MYVTGVDLVEAESICAYKGGKFPPRSEQFIPGVPITETCVVARDYGQDLIFWAKFTSHQTGETTPIPARLEIFDPNDAVILDRQFNEGIIIAYVKPDVYGEYRAIITSLEDPNSRPRPGAPPTVYFAFGFLTPNGYEGVNNPVGSAIEAMIVSGNIATVAGIAIVIFGAVQRYRHK